MQKTVHLKYNFIKDGLSEDDVGNKGDRELLIFLVLCVVLLCAFTFCDVRYDFRIKTMRGSSLPEVVCKMAHFLFMLFVFYCA